MSSKKGFVSLWLGPFENNKPQPQRHCQQLSEAPPKPAAPRKNRAQEPSEHGVVPRRTKNPSNRRYISSSLGHTSQITLQTRLASPSQTRLDTPARPADLCFVWLCDVLLFWRACRFLRLRTFPVKWGSGSHWRCRLACRPASSWTKKKHEQPNAIARQLLLLIFW